VASHTVAPQITGMHDTIFCIYGMEKNSWITKRIRPTAKKGQEAFPSSGGSVRE